jgi:hypothetical protein
MLVPQVPQKVLFTPDFTWREKLAYLTYRFRPITDLPPETCPVKHIFEPGMYVREMFIPAGALFIGRPHRHGHRCELVSGSISHIIDQDTEVQRDAPFEVVTVPGYQMVLRAITDVVGRTYHPNPAESRDEAALELEAFHTVDDMLKLGAEIESRAAGLLT